MKWFTDMPATNGYPKTVVFHANDPMTMVEMGGFNAVRNSKAPIGPSRRRRADGSPSFFAVNYTDHFHAELILPDLKKRGYGTIGLVGPGSMPHAFVTRLKDGLAGSTKFVDATEFIDRLKAIKSEEEIVLIKQMLRRCRTRSSPRSRQHQTRHARHRRDRARRIRRPAARQRAGHLPRLVGAGRTAGALRARHFQGRTLAEGRPSRAA